MIGSALITTWICLELDLRSRNSALFTHNAVTSCLVNLPVGVYLWEFSSPQRLHCTFSSILVVTPQFTSQRSAQKNATEGADLHLYRNCAPCRQSDYLIFILPEQRHHTAVHAVVDETFSPAGRFPPRVPNLLLHCHQFTTTFWIVIFLAHNAQHYLSKKSQVTFAEPPPRLTPPDHSDDDNDDLPALWRTRSWKR